MKKKREQSTIRLDGCISYIIQSVRWMTFVLPALVVTVRHQERKKNFLAEDFIMRRTYITVYLGGHHEVV